MEEERSTSLDETIDNLSQRTEFLTEEALEAKLNYDHVRDTLDSPGEDFDDVMTKSLGEIDTFNDNVRVLLSVFYKSKFDEFLILLANPHRVLTLDFFSGFFKGMGFFLGGLFILFLLAYCLRDTVFLYALIRALLQG